MTKLSGTIIVLFSYATNILIWEQTNPAAGIHGSFNETTFVGDVLEELRRVIADYKAGTTPLLEDAIPIDYFEFYVYEPTNPSDSDCQPMLVSNVSANTITLSGELTNVMPQIEKYVNQDVHLDLVEFDKAFTFDILAYVPEDAESITIADKLPQALEFANKGEGKAEKTTDATVAVASVSVKNSNDHTAKTGTVAQTGDPIPYYVPAINGQTLTIEIQDATDLCGEWVQVTFYAKYTQAVIDAAKIGDAKTVADNGAIVTKVKSHSGTVNQAYYQISTANDSTSSPKYPEVFSNEVTVSPETEDIEIKKVWNGTTGTAGQLKVALKLYANQEDVTVKYADKATITASSAKWTGLPRLIGVTYSVKEETIPGYQAPVYTNNDSSVTDKALNGGTITNTKTTDPTEPTTTADPTEPTTTASGTGTGTTTNTRTSSTTATPTTSNGAPEMGDSSNAVFFIGVMALAVAGMGVLLGVRRKKGEEA